VIEPSAIRAAGPGASRIERQHLFPDKQRAKRRNGRRRASKRPEDFRRSCSGAVSRRRGGTPPRPRGVSTWRVRTPTSGSARSASSGTAT